MQLSFDVRIPDGLLAANALLNEKPHQGVPSWNLALHQGIDERNSTAAIGLRVGQQLGGVRSRYTGKERDAESGNDYFGARYFRSNLGRFLSADWSAKADPIPYAKLNNPQSLNLYAYVQGNAVTLADHDGHHTFNGNRGGEAGPSGDIGGDEHSDESGPYSSAAGRAMLAMMTPGANVAATINAYTDWTASQAARSSTAQQEVSFSTLAANYPGHDAYPTNPNAPNSIWSLIGGHVAMNAFAADGGENNSCAVRMSYDLNASGVPIPKGKGTVSGADGKQYFLRVADLQKFLTGTLGPPQHLSGGSFAGPSGSTGIISFNIPFKDATGHFTLWNGHQVADPKEPYGSWPAPTSTLFWGIK